MANPFYKGKRSGRVDAKGARHFYSTLMPILAMDFPVKHCGWSVSAWHLSSNLTRFVVHY
jgi:hypothetical protein